MHNWLVTTETKQPEYYRGLLIHADEGMHEQMLGKFQKHVARGSTVLDVGAGAGAFSLRLRDSGYKPVGLDLDAEHWGAKEVPFVRADLNGPFSGKFSEKFDAVCCQEVIEHVENPWHLMRQIKDVLVAGGIAVLSTPNVTSFLSRLMFLRTGVLHSFGEDGLSYGHINPVCAFELMHIARSAEMEVLDVAPGGYLPIMDFSSFRPRKLVSNFLRVGSYLVAKGHKRGWTLIFVLRNKS